jgi:hypothetical protein
VSAVFYLRRLRLIKCSSPSKALPRVKRQGIRLRLISLSEKSDVVTLARR